MDLSLLSKLDRGRFVADIKHLVETDQHGRHASELQVVNSQTFQSLFLARALLSLVNQNYLIRFTDDKNDDVWWEIKNVWPGAG